MSPPKIFSPISLTVVLIYLMRPSACQRKNGGFYIIGGRISNTSERFTGILKFNTTTQEIEELENITVPFNSSYIFEPIITKTDDENATEECYVILEVLGYQMCTACVIGRTIECVQLTRGFGSVEAAFHKGKLYFLTDGGSRGEIQLFQINPDGVVTQLLELPPRNEGIYGDNTFYKDGSFISFFRDKLFKIDLDTLVWTIEDLPGLSISSWWKHVLYDGQDVYGDRRRDIDAEGYRGIYKVKPDNTGFTYWEVFGYPGDYDGKVLDNAACVDTKGRRLYLFGGLFERTREYTNGIWWVDLTPTDSSARATGESAYMLFTLPWLLLLLKYL